MERNERNYVKDEQERAFQEAQLADQVRNHNWEGGGGGIRHFSAPSSFSSN